MEMNHVTMLIISVLVMVLGIYLTFGIYPSYINSLYDKVCYVFSYIRGYIFRDKGDYIPNEYERMAYDSISKYIPLPCKSTSHSVKRQEFNSPAEFYDSFLKTIAVEIIRCDNLFNHGTNNPLYPGGSGRNPFVCSTITYDGTGVSITLKDLMEDVNTYPLTTMKLEDRTIGDEIDFYFSIFT